MYLASRLRVAINRAALPFLVFPRPLSLVGPHAALSLCRTIARSGARQVLLVTDAPLVQLGLVDPLRHALEDAGVRVNLFDEVQPDPDDALVLRGVARLRQTGADAVLAVGGGSSIDCAKAMVLCHANHRPPAELRGLWLYARPRRRGLPLFAVPTTAGTGSEVTIAAVIADRDSHTKIALIDPRLTPDMVALDPLLTLGLPPFLTACTGMDALTHAIEAYLSTLARPDTDTLARTACATLVRTLPQVFRNGHDLTAREDMLLASSMAGLAFTRAGVGYVHAFAHQLGGLYGVPHGLANAIVLPEVLAHALPACTHRLADLARCAGVAQASLPDADAATAFIAHIRQLNAAMGIPSTVQALRAQDVDLLIDRAFAEAHGTYGIPRYLDRPTARALLARLLPASPEATATPAASFPASPA